MNSKRSKLPFAVVEPLPEAPPLIAYLDSQITLDMLVERYLTVKTGLVADVQINAVLNAMVKDLTGILTWVFWALGRGAAQRTKNLKRDYRITYRETFDIFLELIEPVMDSRKLELTPGEPGYEEALAKAKKKVKDLAIGLKAMMAGEVFPKAAFEPFMTAAQLKRFEELYLASGRLQRAKLTCGGRLITGGKKLGGSLSRVIDALITHGVKRPDLLRAIQADIRMEEIWSLPEPEAVEPKEKDAPERCTIFRTMSFQEALESIKCKGAQVFQVTNAWEEDGFEFLEVTVYPFWLDNVQHSWQGLVFTLPLTQELTPHGHRWVGRPGELTRTYLPTIGLSKEGVVVETVWDHFRRTMKMELRKWLKRNFTKASLQQAMDRVVLSWMHEMAVSDTVEGVAGPEDYLATKEFNVYVPKEGRDVLEVWAEYEQLFTQVMRGDLSPLHFDLQCTSKGAPGTVITLATEKHYATWGHRINPFFRFLDPKRRSEIREIRKARPLRKVNPMTVQCDKGLPAPFEKRVTELWTVFMDHNYNRYIGPDGEPWHFDTLNVLGAGLAELDAVEEVFFADDDEHLVSVLERLDRQGITRDMVVIDQKPRTVGITDLGPVVRYGYAIRIPGGVEDAGKFKAVVGCGKGIGSHLPYHLEAEMPDGSRQVIHITWLASSAMKKRNTDAGLYMAAAKAGVTKVKEGETLAALTKRIKTALTKKGFNPNGTQKIWLVTPDSETELGEFFCGPLPWFRAPQSELRTFRLRTGREGVVFEPHSMVMADIKHQPDPELDARFADFVRTVTAVNEIAEALKVDARDGEEFGPDPGYDADYGDY